MYTDFFCDVNSYCNNQYLFKKIIVPLVNQDLIQKTSLSKKSKAQPKIYIKYIHELKMFHFTRSFYLARLVSVLCFFIVTVARQPCLCCCSFMPSYNLHCTFISGFNTLMHSYPPGDIFAFPVHLPEML